MPLDLIEFYRVGDHIKKSLIATAKLRNQDLSPELDKELYENIWWKLRFLLTDFNTLIKKIEASQEPQGDSN
jgi:hypothetical protein